MKVSDRIKSLIERATNLYHVELNDDSELNYVQLDMVIRHGRFVLALVKYNYCQNMGVIGTADSDNLLHALSQLDDVLDEIEEAIIPTTLINNGYTYKLVQK